MICLKLSFRIWFGIVIRMNFIFFFQLEPWSIFTELFILPFKKLNKTIRFWVFSKFEFDETNLKIHGNLIPFNYFLLLGPIKNYCVHICNRNVNQKYIYIDNKNSCNKWEIHSKSVLWMCKNSCKCANAIFLFKCKLVIGMHFLLNESLLIHL